MRLINTSSIDQRWIFGLTRWTPLLAALVLGVNFAGAQTNQPASTNRDDVALSTLEQPARIATSELAPPENPGQPINPSEPTDAGPGTLPPPSGDTMADASSPAITAPITNSEAQRSPASVSAKSGAPALQAASSNAITTKAAATAKPGDKPPVQAGGDSPPTTSAKADFSTFKIISERNIFDPNRTPRRKDGPSVRAKTVDSVTLVGIMSYGKGDFAFFNGSSSGYKKVLKPSDTIAGYKLISISANSVTLASGEKRVELKIGSQLRREDEGEWKLSAQPEAYAATSAASSGGGSKSSEADGPSSGAESEVLKRLMQRREQE